MSIKRVRSVEVIKPGPRKDWTVLRFNLEVEGIGDWQREIAIFIPQSTQQEALDP
jgi:hypothetical protein